MSPSSRRCAWLALFLLGSAGCPDEGREPNDAGEGSEKAGERAPTWYACAQGLIALAKVCDGKLDCKGAEDEANCDGTFLCSLGYEEAHVKWGLFPDSAWCDGVLDCTNAAEDEERCPDRKQLVCPDGHGGRQLVTSERFCDGVLDCQDPDLPNDEADCAGVALCEDRAIGTSQLCDGHWDCRSDEFDCPGGEHFTCKDGRTIPLASKCDGEQHCWDGSDEQAATCPHLLSCRGSRPSRSISTDKVCDGHADCPDGWDEQTCGNFFGCGSGLFVRREKRCDGTPDCPEGQDESACAR